MTLSGGISGTGITDVTGGTYVDNSFAVSQGANGCVLTLFGFLPINIDGVINKHSKFPSPAGSNTTIQDFDTEFVAAELVYP